MNLKLELRLHNECPSYNNLIKCAQTKDNILASHVHTGGPDFMPGKAQSYLVAEVNGMACLSCAITELSSLESFIRTSTS